MKVQAFLLLKVGRWNVYRVEFLLDKRVNYGNTWKEKGFRQKLVLMETPYI
jgi:hypothetical protein